MVNNINVKSWRANNYNIQKWLNDIKGTNQNNSYKVLQDLIDCLDITIRTEHKLFDEIEHLRAENERLRDGNESKL